MNYKDYSTEDFIKDEKFINWIKTGDKSLDAYWEGWILSHPEKKQAFMEARILLLNLDFRRDELTPGEKLDLWNKIDGFNRKNSNQTNLIGARQHIEDKKSNEIDSGIIDSNKNSNSFYWRKIAAVLIMIITLAATVYYLVDIRWDFTEKLVYNENIKKNPKGQKLTTYLPDGTKVILNSLSKIRYKAPFIGKERIIELEGEAFFEVKKDTSKPFIVISKGVSTTALGTSFNVNSKSDSYVEVSLVSGMVNVENSFSKSVTLKPGKSAIINQQGELIVQEFNYLDKAGWKDGILVFKNSSFPEIIEKLEDWYGVELKVVVGPKNRIQYTSNFKNESLDEILQGISFVYDFDYKIAGEKVLINFKN